MAPTTPQPAQQAYPALPPLRSLSDFLTDARFTSPTFNEPERMRNRVVQNLLYYQTNYFVAFLLALFAMCTVCPSDFIRGGFLVFSAAAGFVYAKENKELVRRINENNPVVGAILALILGLLLLHFSGKMLIFLAGTTFPLLGAVVHAACRMRNITNKVNNLREMAGLTKSPMGILLDTLGVSQPNTQSRSQSGPERTHEDNTQRIRAVIEEFHQAAAEFTY